MKAEPNTLPPLSSSHLQKPSVSQDLALLRREVEAQLSKRKLELYQPYPKQIEFHNSRTRENLLLAANQVGKTYSGAAHASFHLTGLYPDWYEGRRFDKAVTGWVGGVTGEVTRDTVQRLLFGSHGNFGSGLIPEHCIPKDSIVNARGIPGLIDKATVRHVSGGNSVIKFKNYEQGREKWQGETLDFVWCIAEDELVQMADGSLLSIQNIVPGDKVMTIDNNGVAVIRDVLAVHDRGEKPIVEARLSRGPWLRLTEDHEVFQNAKTKKKILDVKKILMLPALWEPEITTDFDDAYYAWAGLVVSEGSISQKKITMSDRAAVQTAMTLLPKSARVRRKDFHEKHSHVPDWFLYWDNFWSLIEPGLSHNKVVPAFIHTSSNKKIALFLNYLFAGDGWAAGHSISYATTSRVLAQQVSMLLNRLGIRSSITKRISKVKEWKDQWWVGVSSCESVLLFIDKVGIIGKEVAVSKVRVEAERRMFSKNNRNVIHGNSRNKKPNYRPSYASVKSITNVGIARVYDLTIDEHHKFCVGNVIVSNCDEEPPQDLYTEALTRTNATNGVVWMTFTPLLGMSSVVRRFLNEPSDDRAVINMTIDDALHIDAEQRKRIINSYPAHEREARLKGIPMLGSGRIFPVTEELITCQPFKIPFTYKQLAGLDFGWDHPTAACKIAYDPETDVVYVTNVYRVRENTPLNHSAALKAWGPDLYFAWPHDGLQHDKGSGEQLANIYRQNGLKLLSERATFSDGTNGVEAGLMMMLDRMQTGRLKVFDTCTDFFEEFRLYHREEGKVVKEFDDIISSLRYCLMCLRYAQFKPMDKIRDEIREKYNAVGTRQTVQVDYNPLDPLYIAQDEYNPFRN